MKTSTKLFIAGAIFFLLGVIARFPVEFSVLCFLGGFILLVIESIKGTNPKSDANNAKYTAEARKACETVTPKQKRNETPPWEG